MKKQTLDLNASLLQILCFILLLFYVLQVAIQLISLIACLLYGNSGDVNIASWGFEKMFRSRIISLSPL